MSQLLCLRLMLIRCLMGSTNQADPSRFYFRMSWIMMEQCCFFIFYVPLVFCRYLLSLNILCWWLYGGVRKLRWQLGHCYVINAKALPLDSLLLRGISAGPAFRPSRGRAWRRACLRRRARKQKQSPALTPRNNRLSCGRAMINAMQIFHYL